MIERHRSSWELLSTVVDRKKLRKSIKSGVVIYRFAQSQGTPNRHATRRRQWQPDGGRWPPIHNVMKLCDRASVMKNGQLVGTVDVADVTDDDILGMIIMGKKPGKRAA